MILLIGNRAKRAYFQQRLDAMVNL